MGSPCVGVPAATPAEVEADNQMNCRTYNQMRVKVILAFNLGPDPDDGQQVVPMKPFLPCKFTNKINLSQF